MRQLLEKQPSQVFMRAPQWRWNIALASKANPSDSLAPLRPDGSLYESASFYRHLCRQRDAYAYRRRTWPDMSLAYGLWAGASPRSGLGDDTSGAGGWRGLIDALLLAGLPFESFSNALRIDMPSDAVHLYHDNFFDVRSYLDSEPAVFVNVLGAGEQTLPMGKNVETNCMLRLFAYTWGPDAVLEYFFSRNKGVNRMHARWLKSLANEIITRQAIAVAMDKRNFYKEECREIYAGRGSELGRGGDAQEVPA